MTLKYGDESVLFLEIDQPFCSLTYGLGLCTAALSATNPNKCYQSRATCQVPLVYAPQPLTIRFSRAQEGLLQYGYLIPSILSISTSPTTINLGGMDINQSGLGQRESVTVTLSDHLHSDLKIDKYRLERATGVASFTGAPFQPYKQGTFWGKWLARNPYYGFFRARIREGRVGQPLEDMEVRNYVVNQVSIQDDGTVQVLLKDVFSLIDTVKSVAPVANTGHLFADIDDAPTTTSLTLTPPGIGDLEYDTSGAVCLSTEVMTYTRSPGSDVLTVVRAQFGTTIDSHKQEDLVQKCLVYTAQRAHDIVYDLFTNYSDLESSDIVKADWDVAAAALTHLYTTCITTPTPIQDLIGELEQQAGFTVWPDVVTNEVIFKALVASAPSVTVDDDAWIVDGSLSIAPQPALRASEIWVYYGVLDPTGSLNDPNNFHSCAVTADLASEGDQQYGTSAIQQVFSRWLPQFSRTVGLEIGARLLAMFRDPPVQATFSIRDTRAGSLSLASVFVLETARVQTTIGTADSVAHVPIEIERDSQKQELVVTSQQVAFYTPDPSAGRTIFIDNDAQNLNLRAVHDSQYAPPTGVEAIHFIVGPGVTVSTSSPFAFALDTGTWPAGTTLTLQNQGSILGAGGAGGEGGDNDGAVEYDVDNSPAAVGGPGGAGSPGGDAMHVQFAISIDDTTGKIWGGGGGGGGGGEGWVSLGGFDVGTGSGSGGGGGAGVVGGVGGTPGTSTDPSDELHGLIVSGNVGTTGAGTAGGAGTGTGVGGAGGTGGGPGLAGANGSGGASLLGIIGGTGGAGGAAGRYIVGISLVTWTHHGDERGGTA